MKNLLQAVSLSMVLAAPIVFSPLALAEQPEPGSVIYPVQVAQTTEEWQVYSDSKYTYWDAHVLAGFWHQSVDDAKCTIGRKLQAGYETKLMLELALTQARVEALGQVQNLEVFGASGYSYEDAGKVAKFWGDPTPYEGKLRIARNLILGNQQTVNDVLHLDARR